MVYRRDVKDLHQLMTDLETYLLAQLGYAVSLSTKEMDEGVDLTGLERKEDIKTTDEDLALHLLEKLKDDILYDACSKQLWFYNEEEALWREQKVRHLRTLMTKYLIPYVEGSPDPKVPEIFIPLLKSDAKQSSLVRMCEPHIEKRRDNDFIQRHFNRAKGIFPMHNRKVIDLRTGIQRERVKSDYFTKTTERRVVPLSEEKRVELLKYYSDVLKTDSVEYRDCLIGICAYLLTGENNLKKFINLIGTADGGKSCFLELLLLILGEFGGMANERLFVAQKTKSCHDSEMFNLIGKRLSCLTETKEDQQYNEDLIKKISGGDPVNIRGAGEKDTSDIRFDSVLLLATNNVCQFDDHAFKTRLLCFNFCNTFVKDPSIPEKLKADVDCYFTLLTEYAKKYYESNRQVVITEEVDKYTKSIIGKQDTVAVWCTESLTFEQGEGYFLKRDGLYEEYEAYWRGNKRKYLGKNNFYKDFVARFGLGELKKRGANGNRYLGWDDIRRTDVEEEF